ncbi:glycosyltransferase family 2 protein [Rhodoferax aquaticus]|uniref:glycosyltransferase family 2 protein n=1 Tax=Rhodoferax aquaticus TaxID=2527691 RepID=UPI001F33E960|nr:glycosyltransferase family 2 protein [Rhodoferax aquaticus]
MYIIAYNEIDKVRAAIESVSWADEIIVADSFSTDGTTALAAQLGAKVIQVEFNGFGDLRNKAIEACSKDWIFSLDADERCTPEASAEIKQLISSNGVHEVYHTPRRNFFMGRWIQHSGWYPNYRQPQLFRRGAMTYDLKPVHEGYVLHSKLPIGQMKSAIWQFPFKNMAEVMHKANRYSSLGAEKIKHKKISIWTALLHAKWAFWKHYLFKLGFLDGGAGLVIAIGNFEGTFYRYVKAMEIQQEDAWKNVPKVVK